MLQAFRQARRRQLRQQASGFRGGRDRWGWKCRNSNQAHFIMPSNVEAVVPGRLELANHVVHLRNVVVGEPDAEDNHEEPRQTVPQRHPRMSRMCIRPVGAVSVSITPRPEWHEHEPQEHEEEDDADPVRETPEERPAEEEVTARPERQPEKTEHQEDDNAHRSPDRPRVIVQPCGSALGAPLAPLTPPHFTLIPPLLTLIAPRLTRIRRRRRLRWCRRRR